MSGIEFHNTGYGRKFFEHDLPKLTKEIGKAVDNLAKLNDQIDKIFDYKINEVLDEIDKIIDKKIDEVIDRGEGGS